MEKKMVYRFPIPFAHTTPINHNDMPHPKIVHGKNFSYNHWLSKKSHSQWNLGPSNTLPNKMNATITNKDNIEGAYKELPVFRGPPP